MILDQSQTATVWYNVFTDELTVFNFTFTEANQDTMLKFFDYIYVGKL